MHSAHYSTNIHRRSHRNRFSASKLSAETAHTLPEYSPRPEWNDSLAEVESDRPPDYPETANEADANTDSDQEEHLAPPARRLPFHIRRRKRTLASASDPFLDTLLERSVHALEMSNTLLRTTMSTHSSLSTLLSSESESDRFMEVRARNLSTRIRVNSGLQETWMDHLEEISEDVNRLFEGEERGLPLCRSDEGAVSQSLPTTTLPDLRHRRKPSILELNAPSTSHLRYSHPTRDLLVAPAPRALTQYVESTTDPQLIALPSTLGLLAAGSSHSVYSPKPSFACCREPQAVASILSESENTTPAYQFLSSLAKNSGSARFSRCASASPTGTVHGRNQFGTQARVRHSETHQDSSAPLTTLLTTSEPSSSSSESSEHPTGYRTVQSLRKILDDNPSSTSVDLFRRSDTKHHRAQYFLPVTPLPVATQSTSTATASISRLYTKGRHSMSTRPPSPPAHSSLKVRTVPPTPAPSPSTVSLSEVFGSGMARIMGSAPSSEVSTPKRISFAQLPESYSGSQPGSPKLRTWKSRKKSKHGKGSEKEGSNGWLKALLLGGSSSGPQVGMGSREERIEERMTRGWGSRPGYGTVDDWAI